MDYAVRTDAQLGMYLRAQRRHLGLSQAEVAASAGVLQKTVSLIERSPERVTVRTLLSVVAALNANLVIRLQESTGEDESWR